LVAWSFGKKSGAEERGQKDLSISAARLRGSTMSHAAWIRTSWIRGGLRAAWQPLFEDIDVVLCPPMPILAFSHDHSSPNWTRQVDIDGKKVPYGDQIVWAGIATSMSAGDDDTDGA
jgi:amidase